MFSINLISSFSQYSQLQTNDSLIKHTYFATKYSCIRMSSTSPASARSLEIYETTFTDRHPSWVHNINRREYLLEETQRKLQIQSLEKKEKLQLIDTIQRLDLGHCMEDEINAELEKLAVSFDHHEEGDLFTAALYFRLLRQAGYPISQDIFSKFMDINGNFKGSLEEEVLGLLGLYEASHLGAEGEEILVEATEFTRHHLKTWVWKRLPSRLIDEIEQALEDPRHRRLARLEAKRYIEQYAAEMDHDPQLLEFAVLEYNQVQNQHRTELGDITRWWKNLGLADQLDFCRDRFVETFFWIVGLIPEPKYSSCRIEIAKTIAILLVIDDIFDTYGNLDELILFTNAIQRWDVEAMDGLPNYMKLCFLALNNTTEEIGHKILKENGWNVLPQLKLSWIDMIQSYLVEAKWFQSGASPPKLEEYVENGISTCGAYMALVHIFWLIGEETSILNSSQLLNKPYPTLFSSAGRILRLWDDLGTAKEEEERGDVASAIHLLRREKSLSTEECEKLISEEINWQWKVLNGELKSNTMPHSIIKVALNMGRASQVVYNHSENTYLSSVDNFVHELFFAPISS